MFGKNKKYTPTREEARRARSWKFNGLFNKKPLTRSMIRRVGSRARAIELGLIKK